MKQDKSNKIYFLSDQPLKADEISQTKFGHEGIADSVRDIILNCPDRFTIGLFGKWGTGKTTIINILKDKLQNEKVIVEFDVWKHEGDALRRTFLKEIVKQLKENEQIEHELTDRLDKKISRTFQSKFSFDILKLIYPIGLVVLGAVLCAGVINWLWPQFLGMYFSYIFGGTLTAAILVWILQQALTTETTTSTIDRFQDPHEFETEFDNIIKEIPREKNLLVIIDNLDRTRHEKAVELLSTIKTFLEQHNCIFLIVCDDEAIKKHIESVYLKSTEKEENQFSFDPNEFLRKFFNTFVRIPEFIDTELHSYTEELLKETRVEKLRNSDIVHVITAAFRDNPRQIKQFINTLLSHYLLVQEREEGQNPQIKPKGIITDNIAFLAKLMVIRQKSPKDYRKIEEEKLDSVEINKLGEEKSELKEFLNSTKLIPERKIQNIRPFIYLKQSETELKIPDAVELELALLGANQDIVNEIFEHALKSPELLREYETFIVKRLEENSSRTPHPLLSIVSSSLTAVEKNNLEFASTDYYNEVAELLGSNLGNHLHGFRPSLVFDQVIDRCDRRFVPGIASQYTKILSDKSSEDKTFEVTNEWTYELFQKIVSYPNLFEEKKGEISKALSDTYYPDIDILSLFKDESVQKDFISEDVLSKFISTFSEGDIENKNTLNGKIQLFLNFKNVMTSNVIQELISRFNELMKSENQKPFREEKENFLSGIERILNNYHEFVAEIEDKNVLATFGDTITQGIDALGDWDQKKIFIFSCLRLKELLSDPQKANINNLIINFWNTTTSEGIEYVLNNLDAGKKQEVFSEYWNVFTNRTVQDRDIFNTVWSFLEKEKKQELFQHVINSNNYQWGLSKLEELNYEIDFGKKEAVSILLDRVEGVPLPERNNPYKAINVMKCGTDVNLRNKYVTQLKALLKSPDINSQEVGYNALSVATYLSETHKREIMREVIDWLRQLSPITHTYQHSIKSVVLNWGILQPTHKSDFMDIIFVKFIKDNSNMEDIKLGLEIITQTKPTYEDYKTYFDDILVRIKEEQNDDIKTEIKNGLIKIKPDSPNESNEKFWNEFESEDTISKLKK